MYAIKNIFSGYFSEPFETFEEASHAAVRRCDTDTGPSIRKGRRIVDGEGCSWKLVRGRAVWEYLWERAGGEEW